MEPPPPPAVNGFRRWGPTPAVNAWGRVQLVAFPDSLAARWQGPVAWVVLVQGLAERSESRDRGGFLQQKPGQARALDAREPRATHPVTSQGLIESLDSRARNRALGCADSQGPASREGPRWSPPCPAPDDSLDRTQAPGSAQLISSFINNPLQTLVSGGLRRASREPASVHLGSA